MGGSRVLACQVNGNRSCCCVEEETENRLWSWVEVDRHALWILEVTEEVVMGLTSCIFAIQLLNSHVRFLTRHWLGGGANIAPLPLANFLNNFKTRADIDATLTVPYSASIWHPQTKFQENPLRSF